jgi:hypothetical protein
MGARRGGAGQRVTATQQALQRAYAAAEYRVHLANAWLLLRIGHADALADGRLREEAGVRSHWAILTPFNPRSRAAGAWANQRRLGTLIAHLDAAGQRWRPSSNSAAGGTEPVELGVLWCDPPPGAAVAMARRYRQNAIVTGRLGAPTQLQWLT